ncbi:hypothetical protein BJF93_06725 [Xaviernesmea oryzae]|uniref:Uncharacterized protein n=1 Tax=Xaviernesmea oryzae TaxID=464029 RepID=A0A1Q9ASB1_9HYPH|nr:hypothetical protein [Xaviernesmea oryzae]OLP58300.1 hypothetical protein BJF93_06725 [Xaviernesmea oryzae]SEL42885.1 hypothetical protein SAMN04487976_10868 [Xaviernesmea oryzae]
MRRALVSTGGGLACLLATTLIVWGGAASIRTREAAGPSLALETPETMPGSEDPVAALAGSDDASSTGEPDTKTSDQAQSSGEPKAGASPLAASPAPVTTAPLPPPNSAPAGSETASPAQSASSELDMLASSERRDVVLRHPIVLAAGLIRFPEYRVQLAGLVPEDPKRRCGVGRDSWPCGALARTAFRNFVRARAFVCTLPKDLMLPEHQLAKDPPVTAKCSVGGDDPTQWLASQGWADVPEGSDLAPVVEKARAAKLGFFGEDPRKDEAKRMQEAIDTAPDDATANPADSAEPPASP